MSEKSGSARVAIYVILNAIFWAVAMIFASALFDDKPWSADIAPWMAVAWVIFNGLLTTVLIRRNRETGE